MQRFIALASLLVSLVPAEATLQPPLKSVLVPCRERGNLSVIRAIEQNIREVFHASASPEIELFSQYRDFAYFPNSSRILYFPVLS
ncbi:MAG: hypothetical protein WA183_12745 [Chthoniobacterales bacterium]